MHALGPEGFSVPVAMVKHARLHINTAINVGRHIKPGKNPPLPTGKKRQQLTWISSEKNATPDKHAFEKHAFPKDINQAVRAQDSTVKAMHGHQRFGEQLLLTYFTSSTCVNALRDWDQLRHAWS